MTTDPLQGLKVKPDLIKHGVGPKPRTREEIMGQYWAGKPTTPLTPEERQAMTVDLLGKGLSMEQINKRLQQEMTNRWRAALAKDPRLDISEWADQSTLSAYNTRRTLLPFEEMPMFLTVKNPDGTTRQVRNPLRDYFYLKRNLDQKLKEIGYLAFQPPGIRQKILEQQQMLSELYSRASQNQFIMNQNMTPGDEMNNFLQYLAGIQMRKQDQL